MKRLSFSYTTRVQLLCYASGSNDENDDCDAEDCTNCDDDPDVDRSGGGTGFCRNKSIGDRSRNGDSEGIRFANQGMFSNGDRSREVDGSIGDDYTSAAFTGTTVR